MKHFFRGKFFIVIVALSVLSAGCGYLLFRYGSARRAPNDPRYREILNQIRMAQPIAVNVSPDGKYVLTKTELSDGTFQISIKDRASSRVLTTNESANSQRMLTWRPDSQVIVFQESEGLARPLCLLDIKTGKKQRLNAPISQTGLPPLRWDPAGKRLAYFHGDWKTGRLLVIDPEGKKEPLVIKEAMSATSDFVWSPDGNAIALTTTSEPGILTFVELSDLQSKRVEVSPEAKIDGLSWSPDGHSLLMTVRGLKDEYSKLYEMRVPRPDQSDKVIALRAEAEGDISNPLWMPNSRSFIYHVLKDGIICAVVGDRDHPFIKTLGPTNGILRVTDVLPEVKLVCGRFASLTEPPALVEISMETGDSQTIYAPPFLDEVRCPKPQTIRIKSFDGTLVPLYLWTPASTSSSTSKLLIDTHGGEHTQTFPSWEPNTSVLTKRGWQVIAVNYRGSSGFGHAFESLDEFNPENRAQDIVAVWKYAVDVLKVPPQNIYLMGNSKGAGLVASAAVQVQKIGGLILISWVPPEDLNAQTRDLATNSFKFCEFQGNLDPFLTPAEARASVTKFFHETSAIQLHGRYYTFDQEGHFFYESKSSARIYWELTTSM